MTPQRKIPQARPSLGSDEEAAAVSVLQSGMLAAGERVREFESRFGRYVGTKYAVATSNGTTALQVVFQALGLPPSRPKVLTTPFTFIATSNALLYNGLEPVYADVREDSFNLDPERAVSMLTKDVGAALPVHLYGNPASLEELLDACETRGIPVIEDACQAHGARLGGKHVGSFGRASCFSFYPTKNMTTGEGGMITTDDPELADACRVIVNQGQRARYEHVRLGSNYRMTDIAAAIGLVQLEKLDRMVQRRREIARLYAHELGGVEGTALPSESPGSMHSYHQFTLRCDDRSSLMTALEGAGIGYGIYYPSLSYQYPHLRRFASPCPVAERLTENVLSLPMYPDLNDEDIARICDVVRAA